jgi:hypothetical protein
MKLARIIACIVVMVIIGLWVLWINTPALASKALSKRMQVEAKIADIDLSTNSLQIKDVEIGNPKNSVLAKAFSVGSIEVAAPLSHYMSDPLIIDKIEINKVYLGLEFMGPTSLTTNWSVILNNLKGHAQAAAKKEKGRTVVIKKLILTDISSDIVLNQNLGVKNLPHIARLEFDNISSDEGVTHLILDQMVQAVFSNQTLPSPQKALDKLTQPFKDLIPK